jgi:DNA-binding transcriptional MerR regulator
MSWEDIIKGEREYGFYLKQIEKIQDLMDKLYEDIEKAAVKMNQETGYPLEDARKLIQKMQGDTIKAAEETLEELKKKLQDSMRD